LDLLLLDLDLFLFGDCVQLTAEAHSRLALDLLLFFFLRFFKKLSTILIFVFCGAAASAGIFVDSIAYFGVLDRRELLLDLMHLSAALLFERELALVLTI
jgi:hypothetical protein